MLLCGPKANYEIALPYFFIATCRTPGKNLSKSSLAQVINYVLILTRHCVQYMDY